MFSLMRVLMVLEKRWKNSMKYIYPEDCRYRSLRTLKDENGEFHICCREGGDCEYVSNGCPYLISVNSNLNLPNIQGYTQI